MNSLAHTLNPFFYPVKFQIIVQLAILKLDSSGRGGGGTNVISAKISCIHAHAGEVIFSSFFSPSMRC